MTAPGSDEPEHVLVLAPVGRDATLAARQLERIGIAARVCRDAGTLVRGIREGAGCALVTEECLNHKTLAELAPVLAAQPAWSDFPFVVFTSGSQGAPSRDVAQALGNVMLLDRPARVRTMMTAVQAALRARARQYQAKRAIAQRDLFLAMLGHELRNPLGAILLAAEQLDDREDARARDPGQLQTVIARQAGNLGRIVDDLLDVSRVTTGKIVLRSEPVALNALLVRCREQMSATVANRNQTLDISLPTEVVWVDADPVRLEQVFMNLLTNASKYTPKDGHITLSLAGEGDSARVSVTDDGIGIDQSLVSSMFDLFAQAPSSLERAQGGLGLGLTLVRSLTELHGGSVSASSDGPGKGSQFAVELPRAAPPNAVTDPPRETAGSDTLHIVLVEDNDDLRELMEALLVRQGHVVETCADGLGGLERILGSAPDLAIVDLGLPGIDGFEVARRVRAQGRRDIYLIALSGYGQSEDRLRAERAGFDVHLTKPLSAAELRTALAQRNAAAAAD